MRNTILLFFLILFSCSNSDTKSNTMSKHKWNIYSKTNIKGTDYDVRNINFIDDNIGFIMGNLSDDINSYLNNTVINDQKALMYRTNNGGSQWDSITFGNGDLFHSQFIQNKTFRIYKKVSISKGMGEFAYIEAYDTKDLGKSWSTIFKTNIEFLSIHFIDSLWGIGIVPVKNIQEKKIFFTKDGGITWHDLNIGHTYLHNKIFSHDNKFYVLSQKNVLAKRHYDKMIEVSLSDLKINRINIGSEFITDMYIDNVGRFWYSKLENNKTSLLLLNNGVLQSIKKISSTNNLYINNIYCYNNTISLFITETTQSQNIHSFLISNDFGSNFEQETLPSTMKIHPMCFYKENKIWSYIGNGSIQYRQ